MNVKMKARALICCIAAFAQMSCRPRQKEDASSSVITEVPVHEGREPGNYIEGVGEVPVIADNSNSESWRKFVREIGWTGQGNMIHCNLEIDESAPPHEELAEIIANYLNDPYNGQKETGAPGHLRVRDTGAYVLAQLADLSFLVSPFELPYERDLKIRKLIVDYHENQGRGSKISSDGEDE
jgi:hypothetical protein